MNAHYEAALALWQAGRHEEAIGELGLAVEAQPDEVLYIANLAAAFIETRQWPQAEAAARRALAIEPGRAESWFGLGNALAGQQKWLDAAQAYERGYALNSSLPNAALVTAEAFTAAGRALATAGFAHEAHAAHARAAQLVPGNAAGMNNLGSAWQGLARYTEAIESYTGAIAAAPEVPIFRSNLIVALNYSHLHGPADVKWAAIEFDTHCARHLRATRVHENDRDPGRRLRVGYVSPDLRRHAVAYFLLPLLENHSNEVEAVCYSSSKVVDEWTSRLRQASSQWVECADLDDAQLAERIRSDRIDVLVDLAGHTEGNRLLVFARKPTPVQLSWLGYVLTTGLSAMDARLTYAVTDPEGTDDDYTERLVRLEGSMWGYRPLPGMPEPAPPPYLRKGCITFGHLNRYSKVSQPALECWARILHEVPGSRLAIGLPQGAVRTEVARFFENRGVAANRIDAYGAMAHDRFWAMHAEIDIALDPFPFNGGTTSYETLWLGVPLVTCTGEGGGFAPRFSSRMGKALLQAVGLPELVAATPEEYVAISVALARDPQRMERLRHELRERMRRSPLLDEPLHARSIEAAYRKLWREWCQRPAG
ncbi:tetratricopeptide repeat protein [Ramlibacter albus]|uniref:protein O-GlcNAc transferase n=1 Tax=Ramlibacter albus TaxID=2079448 RepID=A0A923M7E1_9BURK|nr:glycosyltransferase family 41 protein [Ramlibacter albus]MBC5764740.1 tetratricopeptide repeat protein [Ramlibacter albus]